MPFSAIFQIEVYPMKISELLSVVDEGWVRKPKWFRVRFQTRVEGQWVTDTMPGEGQTPLDADVVAWRSAWKLSEAAKSGAGEFVNITVVDDRGEPFRYYATGRVEMFNPRPEVLDAPPVGSQPAGSADNGDAFPDVQPSSEEADAEGSSADGSADK
jgi:hypothetical protein